MSAVFKSGYVDAAIYVILSSVVFVFLDDLCKNVEPAMALFIMSGIAIACFNLLNVRAIKHTYSACVTEKWLFLMMSLSLGADWASLTYATYLSDPFVTMAALFVTLAFCSFFHLFKQTGELSNMLSMLLLLISMVVLYETYQIKLSQHLVFGLLLGAVAGLAFFMYIFFSDKLAKRANLSTIEILATRFWILFLGSFFFLPIKALYTTLKDNAFALIVVSFGALIIPIFFNQQAIKKLGPTRSSLLISFVPPMTYLFGSWYNKNLLLGNLFVCIIITIALILPKFFLLRSKA